MIRNFNFILILFILSGCYHTSSSLVGPIYTLASTGNISQTTLSYGLNKTIEKKTGKSSIQYTMEYFKVKKNDKDDDKSTEYTQIDYKILYDLVKSNLEKTKIILSN